MILAEWVTEVTSLLVQTLNPYPVHVEVNKPYTTSFLSRTHGDFRPFTSMSLLLGKTYPKLLLYLSVMGGCLSFIMPNTNDKLHILCFGDSLTAGFWHGGLEFHPYAIKLKEELQKAFPDTEIIVDVDGVSGDFVSSPPGRFLRRIQSKRIYIELSITDWCDDRLTCAGMSQYDWVIILGGTK